ncbi:CD209 antigen-like protein E [Thalassophryne amazonica]|uniref:CD209 antigen-like protein E n=1 Tax=Thalassophryne amazonica TaxID=390379 RepID=UPI0014710205|nr:CD209 antigen-like protein E [Thalassophryne amazonica]
MAVFLPSANSEVGVDEHFPQTEPKPANKTPRKLRHLNVVLVSFGLLCVLQAVLNISLRLVLSESTSHVISEEQSCPASWLLFQSSCYYISSERKTWDESRQACLQQGADLVIIDSKQEQGFLTGFASNAWIGMTDRDEEGTWKWLDGSTVPTDSLLWAAGQPDNAFGGEDCGEIRSMSNFIGLNDLSCRDKINWICEKAAL